MFGAADRLDYDVDLSAPITRNRVRILFTEDNLGTEIALHFKSGNAQQSIAGCTASLRVIRADDATVTLPGTVSDDTATFVLTAACVEVAGTLEINARLSGRGAAKGVWLAEGTVERSGTDIIVDPAATVPSLSALLAQIERMEDLHAVYVLGYYATYAEMSGAHPTASPGDIYGVGTRHPYTYWVWDGVNRAWVNVGDVMCLAANGLVGFVPDTQELTVTNIPAQGTKTVHVDWTGFGAAPVMVSANAVTTHPEYAAISTGRPSASGMDIYVYNTRTSVISSLALRVYAIGKGAGN